MGRSNWRYALAIAVIAASLAPVTASAESSDDETDVRPVKVVEPRLPGFGAAVEDQALEVQRGGQDDAYFNDLRTKAQVYQTSTSNVSTGDNTINGGAFTNSNGMPVVVQNSGNNVVIQNATILNLQVK
jgi:hypothetical protein